MSTDINNAAYSTLNAYAVLASAGITTTLTTTISNGTYGTPPAGAAGITGTYSGVLDTTINGTNAETELTALVGAINGVLTPITTIGTISADYTFYPGRYTSVSSITFTGPINLTFDAQNNPNAQFFITAGTAITLGSVSNIILQNGASNCNIFWLAATGAITFTGTNPPSIPGIFIAASQITFATPANVLGRLYVQYTEPGNITFIGPSSVDAACGIVCYAKGTLILTKRGFVPIENIKVGNKVITRGSIYDNKFIKQNAPLEARPVSWVSKFKVNNPNSKSRPICIKQDALGKNYPFKDLYVSPSHRLLLNGRMILAKKLVNENTIYQDKDCEDVEYYHLECEHHSAIIANGILSETYLDLGDTRFVFENSKSNSNKPKQLQKLQQIQPKKNRNVNIKKMFISR